MQPGFSLCVWFEELTLDRGEAYQMEIFPVEDPPNQLPTSALKGFQLDSCPCAFRAGTFDCSSKM
ncbi:hypothetical protein [Nostoc sp.]|uniref:hypothetical protein n=1 Tax=Nostoc sp. TaxID=1180 RepID=UPI002D769245|nr:hypothetical protein [Nostoc sp.]